jgi:hypothetical protein
MARYVTVGRVSVGPYCGASVFSRRDWKMYGLFLKSERAFSIGPLLFWWD